MEHIVVFILLACVVANGLNCPANTCKSLGQSCTTAPTPNTPTSVCNYGLFCSGTCQTTKGQGAQCESDAECSDNLGCVSAPEACNSESNSQPKWMQGKGLNEWFTIPGTSGAGNTAINAYCGFATNELTNEIFIGLAGGHGDSADNRVVSLKLTDDEPKWVLRHAPSPNVTENVPYYSDGLPAARHTYSNIFFIPQVNRLMFFGARFVYGSAWAFPQYIDGFNPSTNTWDPKGTWTDNIGVGYGTGLVKATGEVFTNALDKWSPNNTWTKASFTRVRDDLLRWPVAHDPVRNQLFNLQWADGEGYGRQEIISTRILLNGSNIQYAITFNPSAGLTQFIEDKPVSAGMDYDPDNDRFLFYCGIGAGAGRIYTVTPNNGNVWDMGILPLGPNSVTPTEPLGSGVNNRFRYIPSLKGFVLLSINWANLSFIRTSDATCNAGTANVRKCSPAVSGPGMTCAQDSDCYYFNSTIGTKQISTCINTKCYGLSSGASCTAANQCNQGLVCKGSTCTAPASEGQACMDQNECQSELFCKKTTKDGTAKACVAFAKGASGSYCEDSAFCGDNLYCNSATMTCATSTQGNCNCSCANPSGFASAVTALQTCWQSNPSCKGSIPCNSCSSQICAIYSLSPSFLSEICTDSPAKKAALQACPVAPTSQPSASPTTGSSGATSKTTTAGSSTSSSSKTTTGSGSSTSSTQPSGSSSSSQGGSTTTGSSPVESSMAASIYISFSVLSLCVAAILCIN